MRIRTSRIADRGSRENPDQTDTEYLSSDKYFETTLNEINSAKIAIVMAMYLVSALPDQPDSQPSQLLSALIRAKDRGVSVKVILDQNINFEAESTEDAITSNKNQQAYEQLKKNNVAVFFDTSDVYTHAKALVIDNETIILGSTNWSKAALTRNNEANVLIRSKDMAQDIESEFFEVESFKDSEEFLGKAYSYQLYFNYIRKNRYRDKKSPLDILRERFSQINEDVLNLPPIRLDHPEETLVAKGRESGYDVPWPALTFFQVCCSENIMW